MPAMGCPSVLRATAAQQCLFAKCAIVIVHQKQAGSGVARDKNVLPAIFVSVKTQPL